MGVYDLPVIQFILVHIICDVSSWIWPYKWFLVSRHVMSQWVPRICWLGCFLSLPTKSLHTVTQLVSTCGIYTSLRQIVIHWINLGLVMIYYATLRVWDHTSLCATPSLPYHPFLAPCRFCPYPSHLCLYAWGRVFLRPCCVQGQRPGGIFGPSADCSGVCCHSYHHRHSGH